MTCENHPAASGAGSQDCSYCALHRERDRAESAERARDEMAAEFDELRKVLGFICDEIGPCSDREKRYGYCAHPNSMFLLPCPVAAARTRLDLMWNFRALARLEARVRAETWREAGKIVHRYDNTEDAAAELERRAQVEGEKA